MIRMQWWLTSTIYFHILAMVLCICVFKHVMVSLNTWFRACSKTRYPKVLRTLIPIDRSIDISIYIYLCWPVAYPWNVMTLAVAHVDQSLTIDDPAFTTMLHALKTTAKSGESTDHARYHDVAQSSASSTIWVCHDMKMHGNVHVNSHGLTTHTILSLSLSLCIYIYMCVWHFVV
jgi:hypothetical protein